MAKLTSTSRFRRNFYLQDSRSVAEQLLGAYLHRITEDGEELIGKIVETEAYGVGDAACHAFRGPTKRNQIMFREGGFSYVYFTYGMHFCFNVTTNAEGIGEAVLIRAVEPILGIEWMRAHRPNVKHDRELTSGPGRLCQAFGLTREQNGIDLIESDELFITKGTTPLLTKERGRGEVGKESGRGKAAKESGTREVSNLIGTSTRIGINVAQDLPWRYFIEGNQYVSRAKPSIPGKIIKRRRTERNA